MASDKLIIDANLLLLLVIGSVEGGRHISSSKRLSGYGVKDVDVLLEVMKAHNEICVTAYLATEVSNLIDLHGNAREAALKFAQQYFSIFTQIDTDIAADVALPNFRPYGLTDGSLAALCSDYRVVTNDNRLLPALYAVSDDNVIPFSFARAAFGR